MRRECRMARGTKIASITITNQRSHDRSHKDKNLGSEDCSMGWYPYAE